MRRLDHVNLLTSAVTPDRDFMMEQLGFRLHENLVMNDNTEAAAWLSVSSLVHEIAYMGDRTGSKGRLHHVCYWYGYPQHLSDLADILVENGVEIEAGPGKHGISQAYFLYVIEPGGNRIELFGDAGYLIFDPTWKPVTWREQNLAKGIIWFGSPLPAEFFLYGTPLGEGRSSLLSMNGKRKQLRRWKHGHSFEPYVIFGSLLLQTCKGELPQCR